MTGFTSIAVYCASSDAISETYKQRARDLGRLLASQNITVVYGGGGVGLMGCVAEGALNHGGQVIGVITQKLMDMEVGRNDLTEMHVVETMRERKALMADLADGFLAMPGGYGTLEELFEVATHTQLRIHLKPVGILNVQGYYDKLIEFIDHAAIEGFIRPVHRHLICVDEDAADLLEKMANSRVPEFDEWLRDK